MKLSAIDDDDKIGRKWFDVFEIDDHYARRKCYFWDVLNELDDITARVNRYFFPQKSKNENVLCFGKKNSLWLGQLCLA